MSCACVSCARAASTPRLPIARAMTDTAIAGINPAVALMTPKFPFAAKCTSTQPSNALAAFTVPPQLRKKFVATKVLLRRTPPEFHADGRCGDCQRRRGTSQRRGGRNSNDPKGSGSGRVSVSGIFTSTSTNRTQVCGCLWLSPSRHGRAAGFQPADVGEIEATPGGQCASGAGFTRYLISGHRLPAVGGIAKHDRTSCARLAGIDERDRLATAERLPDGSVGPGRSHRSSPLTACAPK